MLYSVRSACWFRVDTADICTVGLGKASGSAIERLVQQSEVLVSDLSTNGGSAALINVRKDYMLEK